LIPRLGSREQQALLSDVQARGIQEPLVVNRRNVILDGHERLEVARKLELVSVPVRIVAPRDELKFMVQAALQRRQLNAGQRAALVVTLINLKEERARADSRRRANLRRGSDVATLRLREGRTCEKVAKQAGCGARTATDVITVAIADTRLLDKITAGKKSANAAATSIRQKQRAAALPKAPPLPNGPFELIYADPPWQLGYPEGSGAPENHYPTLAGDKIKALPVPAAAKSVLFLWVPISLLPLGLEVIEAWGFSYRSNLVWVKPSIGPGSWARNRHEHLLLAIRGKHRAPQPTLRPDSVIEAPRRRHSQKPLEAYELIETAYPEASKVELFARGKPRPGWAAWGNEVSK
jgi:N6-adenosine-specific RNA methylase IME4